MAGAGSALELICASWRAPLQRYRTAPRAAFASDRVGALASHSHADFTRGNRFFSAAYPLHFSLESLLSHPCSLSAMGRRDWSDSRSRSAVGHVRSEPTDL